MCCLCTAALEYNNAVVRWAIPTLYTCYASPSLAIQIINIAAVVVGSSGGEQ